MFKIIELSHRILCRALYANYLQMDLKFKFAEAAVSDVIKVNQIEVRRKYPISRAKRFDTKYGESVLLSILGPDKKISLCVSTKVI